MNSVTSPRPAWINESLRQGSLGRPWRKVHLDFHNSEHIPEIGSAFDAEEFGDRLLEGRVDSVVVFAKDMHGYFYYPSAHGPVHPGLSFDLLGEQVQACRQRGIKTYAYYCTTWDNYLAEHHPEWLVWKRDRTTYLPKFDEPPTWTALCLSNSDFVQLMLDHSREILERYEPDGIWYDMPLPIHGECFCRNCLATFRDAGLDPRDTSAQHRHKQDLLTDFMRQTHELAHSIRAGCQVDHNNQTRLGLDERVPYLDNIDIEALPTAFWGYFYFPTDVRYARTTGRSVYGLTGRFHRSWADFGGLKHPTQLRTELAGIVANGAQCGIGDQMPPSGRLDPAVYDTIGKAYAEIERLEPFLTGAAPVTEAAIVTNGDPLLDPAVTASLSMDDPSISGLTKLLMELHIQFDIVEPVAEFERYRLLILPNNLQVDEPLAARLRSYLRGGGAVFADSGALRIHGTDAIWPEQLGLSYRGESPYTPAYLKLDRQHAPVFADLPDYEYALYDGSSEWLPTNPDIVLANLGEPLFQRDAQHYTSHAQAPFDHTTDCAAIVLTDRIAATAFPIGASYYRHGYWIYREIFTRLTQSILDEPLVETSAPISSEVTLTHQAATDDHRERWLVHVVNFSPNRRTPLHGEYLEDPIPLRDVDICLRVPGPIKHAYLAGDRTPLSLVETEHGWETAVPRVDTAEIVVFE